MAEILDKIQPHKHENQGYILEFINHVKNMETSVISKIIDNYNSDRLNDYLDYYRPLWKTKFLRQMYELCLSQYALHVFPILARIIRFEKITISNHSLTTPHNMYAWNVKYDDGYDTAYINDSVKQYDDKVFTDAGFEANYTCFGLFTYELNYD